MTDSVPGPPEGVGPPAAVHQRVVADGNAQVAALGSGTQIVNFFGAQGQLPPVPAMALRSLPRDVVNFVNRDKALNRIIAATTVGGTPAGVIAIDGMAGVGKTALAVRAAHRLAPEFPDAQLYVNLHAHSIGRPPVEPYSALETLLRALGLPASEIPDSLDGRAALWRSQMARRRALVLLDNALASQQAEPLLPGTSSSLVIVTSRQQLVRLEGALRIGLGVLLSDDAVSLFIRIVGREPAGGEAEAVREVVESCAKLPLAVSLCASRLKYRSAWTARNLAAELGRGPGRLRQIRAEHEAVADMFDLSYRGLEPAQQTTFRLLGLHPPQDFSAEAVAALIGSDLAEAQLSLEGLCRHNLLQEPRLGRYVLHDLLHEYALRLAVENDPEDRRSRATDRLLDYYTFVAVRADKLIDLLGSRSLEVEWTPLEAPEFASHVEAISWMEAERANLHAMLRVAVDSSRSVRGTRLGRAMVYFLRLRGFWNEALEICESLARLCEHIEDLAGAADLAFYRGDVLRLTGRHNEALQQYEDVLRAYRRLGDRHREARTLHSIGDIERTARHFAEALERYEAARTVYRELDQPLAEARALHSIADAYRLSGRHDEAVSRYRSLLPIYHTLSDAVGEARVRHAMGELHLVIGSLDEALTECQTALDAFNRLGDRLGVADAELSLGEVYAASREHGTSIRHYRRARLAYQALGDRRGRAKALWGTGGALIAAGHTMPARLVLEEALAVFDGLGAVAEADRIRAILAQIG